MPTIADRQPTVAPQHSLFVQISPPKRQSVPVGSTVQFQCIVRSPVRNGGGSIDIVKPHVSYSTDYVHGCVDQSGRETPVPGL